MVSTDRSLGITTKLRNKFSFEIIKIKNTLRLYVKYDFVQSSGRLLRFLSCTKNNLYFLFSYYFMIRIIIFVVELTQLFRLLK